MYHMKKYRNYLVGVECIHEGDIDEVLDPIFFYSTAQKMMLILLLLIINTHQSHLYDLIHTDCLHSSCNVCFHSESTFNPTSFPFVNDELMLYSMYIVWIIF